MPKYILELFFCLLVLPMLCFAVSKSLTEVMEEFGVKTTRKQKWRVFGFTITIFALLFVMLFTLMFIIIHD